MQRCDWLRALVHSPQSEDLKIMDNGVIFGFAVGVGCGLCLGYFLKGKDRPSGSNSTLDDGEEVSKI